MIHTQCLLIDNNVFEKKLHHNKRVTKIKQHIIRIMKKTPRDHPFLAIAASRAENL